MLRRKCLWGSHGHRGPRTRTCILGHSVWPALSPSLIGLTYLAKRDFRAASRPQAPRPLVNVTHLSTAADARLKSLPTEWPSSCTQSRTSPRSWSQTWTERAASDSRTERQHLQPPIHGEVT